MRRMLLASLLAAACLGPAAALAGADPASVVTWDGGAGTNLWSDKANWSGDTLPGAGDAVQIPAGASVVFSTTASVDSVQVDGSLTMTTGTLTLASDSTAATFTMSGGTLAGAGRLTLTGTATFSGGTETGTGTTTVAAGATATQSNSHTLNSGRVLEIAGTYQQSGAFTLFTGGSPAPLVHVLSGGVLRGTPTGTSGVSPPLDNDGSVQPGGGTLQLGGGGAPASSGTFGDGAAQGTIELRGNPITLGDGAKLAGGVTIATGDVDIPSGTVTASGTNAMSGGTLSGAGTLNVAAGGWTLSGGTETGTGTTHVSAGATFTQTNSHTLNSGRVLEIAGTYQQSGAFTLFTGGSPAPLVHVLSGGLLRGTPTGTSGISPPLDNDGSVQPGGGTLQLGGGGASASSGTFGDGAAQGTVELRGNPITLADGAKLAGGVTIATGDVDIPSGTVTATGSNAMSNGTLSGAGTLNVASGGWTLSGGTETGTGTTHVAAGATFTQTNSHTLNSGRVLEIAGTYAQSGAFTLFTGGSPAPLVHVLSGGLLQGTPTGTSGISPPLDNDGSVQPGGGTLQLTGGNASASSGTFGGGAAQGTVELRGNPFTLADGAKLAGGVALAAGDTDIPSGTVTSTGANAISNGTLSGAGTLDVTSGGWTLSGGTESGAGTTRLAAGATFTQTGSHSLINGRTLEIAGTYAVSGDRTLFSGGATAPLVHVLSGGTLRKTSGTQSASIDPALDNDGTVEGTAGRLELDRGAAQAQTGTFRGAGGSVAFTGGTHVLGAGADLQGATAVDGGTLQLSSPVSLAGGDVLVLSGGALTGTLDVGAGELDLGGGELQGPGTATVGPQGTVLLNGDCFSELTDGYALANAGTLRVPQGHDLYLSGDGTRVDNSGRIELGSPATPGCSGGVDVFGDTLANTGTIDQVGSGGDNSIEGLDNDGTLTVSAGGLTVEPADGARQDGSFAATAPGAFLAFDGGTVALGPAAALAGDLRLTGADLDIPAGARIALGPADKLTVDGSAIQGDGTLSVAGTLDWRSGTMTGSGTTDLAPGSTATIGGPDDELDLEAGRRLVNRGTLTLAGGALVGYEGASILNTGTFTIAGPVEFAGYYVDTIFGYASLFHNTGTLAKTGADDVELDWALDNDGTVTASGGTLRVPGLLNLEDDGTLVGGALAARGATIALAEPVQTLGGHVLLDGAGARIGAVDAFDPQQAPTDGLTALRRIGANGMLEVRGGASQAVGGALLDGGETVVGSGGTLAVAGAYRQVAPSVTDLALDGRLTAASFASDAGSLLRARLVPAAAAPLQLTGTAALAGALDLVTAAALPSGDQPLISAGSVTGAFAPVTGGYPVVVGPNEVHVHVAAPAPASMRAVAPVALAPAAPAIGAPLAAPLAVLRRMPAVHRRHARHRARAHRSARKPARAATRGRVASRRGPKRAARTHTATAAAVPSKAPARTSAG